MSLVLRFVNRPNHRPARNVTNRDIITELLREWAPMWLTDREIVVLSWRHIPTRERHRVYRALTAEGLMRTEKRHGDVRMYWHQGDR